MKRFSNLTSKVINKLGRFLDKYGMATFIIFWFVFVMFCFFMWGYMEVSAAAEQDYFPMEQNKNGHFGQNVIDAIGNRFDDENYYIFVMYIDYNYFLIRYPKSQKVNGMICGEKSNNLQTFSLYMVGSIENCNGYQFQYGYNQILNESFLGVNPFGYFQNLPSSNYNSNYDYISNFKVYTNNTSSKLLVLNYDEQPEYSDPENDTYPENFEQPKLSDYFNENDIPSFNNTDTMSALQSLYSIISWGFGDGLKGLINFIVDSMNWGFQKIINNFRNVIKSLQDAIEDYVETINGWLSDIKDWVGDIKDGFEDFVDLIIEPWDSQEFQSQLSNSSFYGALDSTITDIRSFGTSLTRANEPLTLSFTIDLTSIGWGRSEISFDWIKDFRYVIRLIIGCVLVYWLVITIITSINNVIGSGGDGND